MESDLGKMVVRKGVFNPGGERTGWTSTSSIVKQVEMEEKLRGFECRRLPSYDSVEDGSKALPCCADNVALFFQPSFLTINATWSATSPP
jgi:hypothetical protein